MSFSASTKTHDRKLREHKETFKLILSTNFIDQVDYFHKKESVEWSGLLICSIISGSIADPKTLVIQADEFVPMDIGTSAYTEYTYDPKDKYSMDIIKDALLNRKKIGHIHTHHSMNIFFSGTDMDELYDNAPNHNWYLSLIVGYKNPLEWIAKIAQCCEEKFEGSYTYTKTFSDDSGKKVETGESKLDESHKYLDTWNAKVCLEESANNISENFVKRYEELKKEKAKTTYNHNFGYSRNNSINLFSEQEEDDMYSANLLPIERKHLEKAEALFSKNDIREFTTRFLFNDFKSKKIHLLTNAVAKFINKSYQDRMAYKEDIMFDLLINMDSFFDIKKVKDANKLDLYHHIIASKMIKLLGYHDEHFAIVNLVKDIKEQLIIPGELLPGYLVPSNNVEAD